MKARFMVGDKLTGFITIDKAGEELLSQYPVGKILEITVTDKRSLDQNALVHKWFGIIAKHQGDTPENIKCFCKHEYGVPILRAQDKEFNSFYRHCISGLTYEQKLKAIKHISITSRMSKKQLSTCLEHIQQSYAEQGIVLSSNIDDEYNIK